MKRVLTIGGGLVAVIAILWFVIATFVFPSLGSVVKAAVEQVGSDLTQTTVRLDDVELSLTDGKGSFHGLHMTNPSGFEETDAFAFDLVSIDVDIATLASDTIVINEIVVEKPRILYEIGEKGTNIDTIRGHVESQQGAEKASGGDSSEGPSFVIKNLYLRDGTVSVAATGLFDEKLSVPLPDIHLTDVGKDGAGASPGDIVEQTLAAVGGGITTAVADIDLDSIRQGAEEAAESAGKAIGEAADETGKAAGEVGEAIGEGAEEAGNAVSEGAEEAGKAIKGLFD